MQQALLLVELMPDSALTILNSINTSNFNDVENAEYTLLRTQARSNAGMDLSNDNQIFDAYNILTHKNDPEKAALASFYAALVSTYQNNPTVALEYYQEAFEFVKNTDNKLLQGKILFNIGHLNYRKGWHTDAIIRCQHALKIFQSLEGQYQREVSTLNIIANSFMIINQVDSAKCYYQKALNLAKSNDNPNMQMRIYINIGVAYEKHGQPDSLIYYSKKALNLESNYDSKAQLYMSIARTFSGKNIHDSANYYLSKAEPLIEIIDNMYIKAGLADSYYLIEKNAGNYKKALEYFEVYSELKIKILDNNDRKLFLELQKKYDLTVKENEHNKARSRFWKTIVILCSILLMLTVYIIYSLRKREETKREITELENSLQQMQTLHEMYSCALRNNEKIERENTELQNSLQQMQSLHEIHNQKDNEMKMLFIQKMQLEDEMILMQNLYENLNQTDRHTKSIFFKTVGLFKNLAILNPYFKDNAEKDNKITLTNDEKDKIIKETKKIVQSFKTKNFVNIANELSPNFTVRLRQKYNTLTDREVNICCLILFGFNNEELDVLISDRLNATKNSIQNYKTTLKRKLDLDRKDDIRVFLFDFINHQPTT